MLVSGRFFFVRSPPAWQIPNFKTPAIAYESDFVFQSNFLAEFVRQNEATLPVRGCMLSAGMQLTQEHAAIARGNLLVRFCGRTHFREFLRRHDQQKLVCGLRQQNEILRTIASPPGRDCDPVFLVNGMPELSGIKAFGLGIGVHGLVEQWPTLLHLTPPLTTSLAGGQ